MIYFPVWCSQFYWDEGKGETKMKAVIMMALLVSLAALGANLVEKQPFEFTQPDGSSLSLFVSGDEYYHRVHDAQGFTILQHPESGYAVYAVPDGNSIKASDYRVGLTDPFSLGIQPNLFNQDPSIEKKYKEQQRLRTSGNRADPTGSVNNIVVFVRFSDQTEFPTSTTYTWYNNLFNSTSQQSLADFYDEVSSGQLDINTYLYSSSGSYVLSVQVSHTRGYYSPYNASTNPSGYSNDTEENNRHWGLFTELVGLTDPLVPAGIDVDNDDDSNIDALTYIFRGATDNWGDILWPAHVSWTGSLGTINGTPVWHYVKDFEGGLGSSVICHEMGHMIGFPDLYHYTSNGITPVGGWSLMASDNTQHELAYEKWKYGTWFASIPTITPTTTPTVYTLDSIETSPYECYKIASNYANAFYMVEYRGDVGRYESGVPGPGLIVYRVQDTFAGTNIDGNAGGPPDELYVYRPGGDINTNGTVNNAGFSSTAGRTKIHNGADPEPWMLSSSSTQADGNLCITDVTATGGTTISFTLRDSPPNIWDGSTSTAWNTASNWSLNHVPTSSEDVEVPGSLTRYPAVTSSQSCRSLLVKTGASLSIGIGDLSIINNYTTYGALSLTDDASYLYVGADLYFETGSTASAVANSDIYVQSDVEFRAGSNVNLTNGNIYLYGNSTSYIRTYAAASIYHLRCYKNATNICGISAASTATLTIAGSLNVYGGSTFTHPETGTTVVKGGISVATGGLMTCSQGTISMEGNINTSIYIYDSGSYFHNLTIAKGSAYTVGLSYPIDVDVNLTITSGTLNANSKTINVGGNWSNTAGVGYFTEGTGIVIFDGAGTQTVSTETFYNLTLNKASGTMSIGTGATVNCSVYDWTAGGYTVSGGTFAVADLADAGVYGSITLTSGTINYTQDTGQYIDLNGIITIDGGTFNINGGSSTCWFGYGTATTLNMTAGTLDLKSVGIYISSGQAFTENISGGVIRTVGAFYTNRTDFTPTGGTLEMYGTADVTLYLATGSNLAFLLVNKTTTTREAELPGQETEFMREHDGIVRPITRSNTVTLSGNTLVSITLTLSTGTLDVNGYTLTVNNDLLVYGNLKMTVAGTIDVADDFYWYGTSTSNITAGNLYCGGYWYFASGTSINLTGTTTTMDRASGAYMYTYSSASQFGNLILLATAGTREFNCSYSTSGVFRVTANLTLNGTSTLNINAGNAIVSGNVIVNTGTQITTGTSSILTINGDLDLAGTLLINPGTVTVHGEYITHASTVFTNNSGTFVNDEAWETRTNVIYIYGAMTVNGGTFEITHKSLSIQAHATRVFTNANIRLGAGFVANGVNCYQPTGGGLYMINDLTPVLQLDSSNWLSNLYVQKNNISNGVYVQQNTVIKGNVTITGGKLITNNFNLTVGGNWTNSFGSSAFAAGTGTVIFNQVGVVQTISGANNFYNVTDSHTGAALDFTGLTGISGTLIVNNIVTMESGATIGTVINSAAGAILAFYYSQTYTINSYTGGGSLRAWANSYVVIDDLAQNGLYGSFTADTGHLEFHQDAGNWIDLNGNMTIANDGIVDIYGGSMDCYMAYNGNSVFTMSSGQFNVKNFGFYFYNNGHTGDFQISGGTIRANGNWTDTWGIFDPTGGTVEFTGNTDAVIAAHASSWFWTLVVNKPSTRDASEPAFTTDHAGNTTPITRMSNMTINACTIKAGYTQTAANIVYLVGTMTSLNAGNFNLNGGVFRLNGFTLISTGNMTINSIMALDPLSILQMGSGKTINVNSGGTLLSVGNAPNNAMISHYSSGNYGLFINSGGTLGAQYTIFEYMNTSGVCIRPGAIVDNANKLDYCTFRLGASGGRLLWINNGQSLTITGAAFPTNTWGGAYNVSKTVDSGIVYFASWTGGFGGPTYEQDSYNHIYWQGYGNPPITDIHITYIPATNRVQLDWTYPFAATSYKIYRSTNPYGMFTYNASTTTNTWSVVQVGHRYFYKVTAVMP
jgi:M6 family metalloprotease-like protein